MFVLVIRQPIISVLGHVDSGKTSFLDRIRGTAVAKKEAGAITQHIGATEVPISVIEKISGKLLQKFGFRLEIPGLLFIDTPGHEAFTNLRKRGGSIADLAVVIVDINQGFQQQTLEAIEILRGFKTPFVLGLNKIDAVHGYDSVGESFSENFVRQHPGIQKALDEKLYEAVGKLHGLGFQSERFDRCEDFSKQIAIVPVSAKTGEGIAEMLMLLAGLSQRFLKNKLSVSESDAGKGNVLEVREEKGLGTTLDIILFQGCLSANELIVLAGKKGIIKTKIRALLKPKPLEEIRETEKFQSVKKVFAASGVKISAPNLEEALPGSPVIAVKDGKEEQLVSKEILGIRIVGQQLGPIIKADTLGSLEALTILLEKETGIKPKKADIGALNRKDVLEASGVKEHDSLNAVIFAFNVKIDDIAEKEAQKMGIKIIAGNVIYKLLEEFIEWLAEEKEKGKQARLEHLVFPAKLEILPNHTFRNSKPAIVGVRITAGKLKQGAKLMNSKGIIVGKVTGIQSKKESLGKAGKGEEVAISIDDAIVGRNISEKSTLYTFIPEKTLEQLLEMKDFSSEEKELLAEIKRLQKNSGEGEEK